MASICYYGGKPHRHENALQARACYQRTIAGQPPLPSERITTAQREYIHRLGGDMKAASVMTKRVASRYIDALKAEARARATAARAPMAARVAIVDPTATEPVATPASTPSTVIPLGLLEMIPSAHFAVRPDSNEPYTFLRLRRPKTGRYKGCIVFQTMHGERFISRFVLFPSGEFWFDPTTRKTWLETIILLVLSDYRHAVKTYARVIGRCGICGKALTDERSRWYGIGPDCETRHGWMIEVTDEDEGRPYQPGMQRGE